MSPIDLFVSRLNAPRHFKRCEIVVPLIPSRTDHESDIYRESLFIRRYLIKLDYRCQYSSWYLGDWAP